MKKLLAALFCFCMLVQVSCKKTVVHKTKVVRDCTGTYVECAGKHYLVCNSDVLEKYPDGTEVKLSFKRIKDCTSNGEVAVCMMAHEHEGWIEVLKIK